MGCFFCFKLFFLLYSFFFLGASYFYFKKYFLNVQLQCIRDAYVQKKNLKCIIIQLVYSKYVEFVLLFKAYVVNAL